MTSDEFVAWATKNQPRAFRRELVEAIQILEYAIKQEGLGQPSWLEVLSRYREANKKSAQVRMTHMGLHGQLVWDAARNLDSAFRRLKNFNPDDFICAPIIAEVTSRAARTKRPNAQTRNEKLIEIGAWLKQKGYADSLDKAGLVVQATAKFKCGETDVKDAARFTGLTRAYGKRQLPK